MPSLSFRRHNRRSTSLAISSLLCESRLGFSKKGTHLTSLTRRQALLDVASRTSVWTLICTCVEETSCGSIEDFYTNDNNLVNPGDALTCQVSEGDATAITDAALTGDIGNVCEVACDAGYEFSGASGDSLTCGNPVGYAEAVWMPTASAVVCEPGVFGCLCVFFESCSRCPCGLKV